MDRTFKGRKRLADDRDRRDGNRDTAAGTNTEGRTGIGVIRGCTGLMTFCLAGILFMDGHSFIHAWRGGQAEDVNAQDEGNIFHDLLIQRYLWQKYNK